MMFYPCNACGGTGARAASGPVTTIDGSEVCGLCRGRGGEAKPTALNLLWSLLQDYPKCVSLDDEVLLVRQEPVLLEHRAREGPRAEPSGRLVSSDVYGSGAFQPLSTGA